MYPIVKLNFIGEEIGRTTMPKNHFEKVYTPKQQLTLLGGGEVKIDGDSYVKLIQGEVSNNDHYYIDVSGLSKIDFYVIARLYGITDPNVQHTVKKLLALGRRSGGKSEAQDIQDCIDSLQRKLDIDKQFLDMGKDK